MVLEYFCPICDDEYLANDDIFITGCGHVFHKKCLFTWIDEKNTCPDCRTKCSGYNTFKVFIKYRDSQHVDEMIKLLHNNEDEIQNLRLQLHDYNEKNEMIKDLESKIKEKSLELEVFYLKLDKVKEILFSKPTKPNEIGEGELENMIQNASLKTVKEIDLQVIYKGTNTIEQNLKNLNIQSSKSNFSAIDELHVHNKANKNTNGTGPARADSPHAAGVKTTESIFKDLKIELIKNNSYPFIAPRQINSKSFNNGRGATWHGQKTQDKSFYTTKSVNRFNRSPRTEPNSVRADSTHTSAVGMESNLKDLNFQTRKSDSDDNGKIKEVKEAHKTAGCDAEAIPKQLAGVKSVQANLNNFNIESSKSDAKLFGECHSLIEAKQTTDGVDGVVPKLIARAYPSHDTGIETKEPALPNLDIQPGQNHSQPLNKLTTLNEADKTGGSGAGSFQTGVVSTMDSNLKDLKVQTSTSNSNNSDKACGGFGAIPKHNRKASPTHTLGFKPMEPCIKNFNFSKSNASPIGEIHTQIEFNKTVASSTGAIPKHSIRADSGQAAAVKTMEPYSTIFYFQATKSNSDEVCQGSLNISDCGTVSNKSQKLRPMRKPKIRFIDRMKPKIENALAKANFPA